MKPGWKWWRKASQEPARWACKHELFACEDGVATCLDCGAQLPELRPIAIDVLLLNAFERAGW